MRVLLQKQMGAFRPGNDDAETLLSKLKHGEFVWADVKRGRNLAHHRKLWKMLQIVTDNQTVYPNAEAVCAAFKVAVGHCTYIDTPLGRCALPKSIAFASMDQTEFERFYDSAVDYCTTKVIPGLDSAALKREVEELL